MGHMKKLSARMLAARRRRQAEALATAVARFGSKSALARTLAVSPQAVQQWAIKQVPLERCAPIELVTAGMVQCEELREDYRVLEVRPYRHRGPLDAVYLSGPMTGLTERNYPAFHAEARRLRALGWRVVNPAESQLPADSEWGAFLRADIIEMLGHCDTVVALPGWRRSKGARLEILIARAIGMRVLDAGALL